MAYDDEPYWYNKKSSSTDKVKTKYKPVVIRSIPDASDVLAQIDREPRAPEPSPLLKEFMEKKNKDESK